MSYQIPETEPSQVIAGDTIQFKIALSDYPANDGWVLNYRLVGSAADPFTWSSTADGVDHSFSIAGTTSDDYTAGIYQATKYVTKAATSERYTLETLTIEIKANPVAITTATDTRTHVKKVLDALEAHIEGKASALQLEYDCDGTRIKYMTPEQILMFYTRYQEFYRQEQVAEKLARGLGTKTGKIQVRFTR